MQKITYNGTHYQTKKQSISGLAQLFPSVVFYLHLIWIVIKASRVARKGLYDGVRWVDDSLNVLKALEKVGIRVHISGIDNVSRHDGPVIIVGNHMSMMETLLLPGIVRPVQAVTFVIKEALLSYPVFKYVMQSRNPVAVTRTNPRQDLKTVMNEGVARVKDNISVIVFPQTTRSHSFDAKQMSSIGVKLAKKAGVPIVPLALKTDCWQNGRKFKDFGKLDVSKTAYFEFGEPFFVISKGADEQAQINEFIAAKLKQWDDK
ncbi:MAG: lysophospholipid acyltransferase family protein [Desulforhopalus sp.]